MTRILRTAAFAASVFALSACSGAGGLGSVLGSVLGGGQQQQGQQLSGSVRSLDTRNQQITVRQSNGQDVAVLYDQNTKLVYQNKLNSVTNLEAGDQITARIQTTQNNAYYADSITVTQSVSPSGSTSGGTAGESVQQIGGTVSSIDRSNGTFLIDVGSGTRITVSMPYQPRTADANTFNNLRIGQNVRLYGVYLNNTRVELRQFY
ncbi:MAG: hypothetical protein ABIR92_12270 [Gemmatimonadaceae bacterium]